VPDDLWFYLLAVPAILLIGISKSGFGGGMGLLGVPLMALAVDPRMAAAILLPILCLMDAFALWAYRGLWHRRHLAILAAGAAVGILLGALTFEYVSTAAMRLLVGVIALAFVANWLFRPAAARASDPEPRLLSGSFWGALSGFTSFTAHAGGPPVAMYLLPRRLDKSLFQGTTVVFFALVNLTKLFPYAWLGQFSREVLLTALVLAPLVPPAIGLGLLLHRRVPQETFYRLCYLLLSLVGTKLVWDGVTGLAGW